MLPPFAVLQLYTSRHEFPDVTPVRIAYTPVFTSTILNFWLLAPLKEYCRIFAPSAVLFPDTSITFE